MKLFSLWTLFLSLVESFLKSCRGGEEGGRGREEGGRGRETEREKERERERERERGGGGGGAEDGKEREGEREEKEEETAMAVLPRGLLRGDLLCRGLLECLRMTTDRCRQETRQHGRTRTQQTRLATRINLLTISLPPLFLYLFPSYLSKTREQSAHFFTIQRSLDNCCRAFRSELPQK